MQLKAKSFIALSSSVDSNQGLINTQSHWISRRSGVQKMNIFYHKQTYMYTQGNYLCN